MNVKKLWFLLMAVKCSKKNVRFAYALDFKIKIYFKKFFFVIKIMQSINHILYVNCSTLIFEWKRNELSSHEKGIFIETNSVYIYITNFCCTYLENIFSNQCACSIFGTLKLNWGQRMENDKSAKKSKIFFLNKKMS